MKLWYLYILLTMKNKEIASYELMVYIYTLLMKNKEITSYELMYYL